MAKMTVDRIVEREAREAPCRTHEIPLGQAIDASELERVAGVSDAAYPALAERYGHHARDVLAIVKERPQLAAPILDGLPDLLAEAVYGTRHEQASTIGDVLLRRTRVGLLAARRATDADTLERVAAALSQELGWDAARSAAEIAGFRFEAAAEGIVVAAAAAPA
jgi:glycerol-3-phosphate dehydrogenase